MVVQFLAPFIVAEYLLPRSTKEIEKLLRADAFTAKHGSRIVGFVALEIYSRKLAEIQCLAVDQDYRRLGIGRALVNRCVGRAAERGVQELMAISASDEMFMACGFDYSLPNQKRALFIQPRQ